MAAISTGIPITITNTNHELNESYIGDEYPDEVVNRGKSAAKLEEVKEKKERQIFSKWNDTDLKIYTKKKQRIKCNKLKGEEQEQTLEFFSPLFITRIAL